MKHFYFFYFLVATFFLPISLFAQDMEICEGDSISLQLSDDVYGEVFWQKSTNGDSWQFINTISAHQLNLKPTENIYTRAAIVDGECDTLFSSRKLTVVKTKPEMDFDIISDTSNLFYMDVLSIDTNPNLKYWFNFNDSISTNFLQGDTLHFRTPFIKNSIEVFAVNDEGCHSDSVYINYESLPIAKLKDDTYYFAENIEQLNIDTSYQYKTLHFSKNIPTNVLKKNNLIFGGDPENGFLIRIKDFTEDDSSYVITGILATMFDIIPNENRNEDIIVNLAKLERSNGREGIVTENYNLASIDFNLNSIDLKGNFTLADVALQVTTSDPEIEELDDGFRFNPHIDEFSIQIKRKIGIELEGKTEFNEEIELLTKKKHSFFFVGWFPVYYSLNFNLTSTLAASLEAQAGINFQDGITYNYEIKKSEVIVDNETFSTNFNLDYEKTTKYEKENLDLSASALIKFELQPLTPEFSLQFYGLLGPYVSFPWGIDTKAEFSTDNYWGIESRLRGTFELGGRLEVPNSDNDEEKEKIEIKYELPIFDTLLYKAPHRIQYVSGNEQIAEPGNSMPDSLVIKVLDSQYEPLQNAMVMFESDTTFSDLVNNESKVIVNSNSDGEASVNWELGEKEGYREVTAVVHDSESMPITGGPVVFHRDCASTLEGLPEDWWEQLEDDMKRILNSSWSLEKPSDEELKEMFCKRHQIRSYLWDESKGENVNLKVSDISILERFVNLHFVYITSENLRGGVSFRNSKKLKDLRIIGPLESLDISKNHELESLTLGNQAYDSLLITNKPFLSKIDLSSYFYPNEFKYLHVENCQKLNNLYSNNGKVETIVIKNNDNLRNINLKEPNLKKLEMVNLASIGQIDILSSNLSGELDLRNLNSLWSVTIGYSKINALNITGLFNLSGLKVVYSEISQIIGLETCKSIKNLNVSNNKISSLNLTGLTEIERLNVSYNNISEINLKDLSKLEILTAQKNKISSLILPDIIFPELILNFDFNYYPLSNFENLLSHLPCSVRMGVGHSLCDYSIDSSNCRSCLLAKYAWQANCK